MIFCSFASCHAVYIKGYRARCQHAQYLSVPSVAIPRAMYDLIELVLEDLRLSPIIRLSADYFRAFVLLRMVLKNEMMYAKDIWTEYQVFTSMPYAATIDGSM